MSKAMLSKPTTVFAGIVLCMIVAGACSVNGNLLVGPVRVTATIGEASFVETLFSLKGAATITHKQKFCDMPTEDELQEQVTTVGEIDLSSFIRLEKLELVETVLTATSGDFDFMTEMTVRFLPQPGAGSPVVLGTASNPAGLGTEVVLVPEDGVDFLALIRANDAAGDDACPRIEYEMTFNSIPTEDIEYRLDITVDGFAEVGRDKVLSAIAR